MKPEFEAVVREESQRLYLLCYRLTGNGPEAEDLLQEAFTKAFKAFRKFEERSQVSTWLYRIVMNSWKNRLRSKSRNPLTRFFTKTDDDGVEIEEEFAGHDAPVGSEVEQSESSQLLHTALKSLAPEEREIVILRDLEEKSYEELSRVLEIPMGTVKSRLARAREALRLKLVPLLKAKGEL